MESRGMRPDTPRPPRYKNVTFDSCGDDSDGEDFRNAVRSRQRRRQKKHERERQQSTFQERYRHGASQYQDHKTSEKTLPHYDYADEVPSGQNLNQATTTRTENVSRYGIRYDEEFQPLEYNFSSTEMPRPKSQSNASKRPANDMRPSMMYDYHQQGGQHNFQGARHASPQKSFTTDSGYCTNFTPTNSSGAHYDGDGLSVAADENLYQERMANDMAQRKYTPARMESYNNVRRSRKHTVSSRNKGSLFAGAVDAEIVSSDSEEDIKLAQRSRRQRRPDTPMVPRPGNRANPYAPPPRNVYPLIPQPAYNERSTPRRKEKEPAKYDGKTDLVDYLYHFSKVAKRNGWSYDDWGLELGTSLAGEARSVLTEIPPEQEDDYFAIVHALIRRFDPEGREAKYSAEFLERTCGPTEDVCSYGHNLRRLARKAYPGWMLPEQVLVDIFIKGCPEEDMIKELTLAEPNSLDEAIRIATKCETYKKRCKQRKDAVIFTLETKTDAQRDIPSNSANPQQTGQNMKPTVQPAQQQQQQSGPPQNNTGGTGNYNNYGQRFGGDYNRQQYNNDQQQMSYKQYRAAQNNNKGQDGVPQGKAVVCWRCGFVGHYANQCSYPIGQVPAPNTSQDARKSQPLN